MILKILLTGAPLSGKTTIINELKKLNIYGFKFLAIPEIASLVIESGYDDMDFEWQLQICKLYVAKEKIYLDIAKKLEEQYKCVVIVYDRYVSDCLVYLDNQEWHKVINEVYQDQPNIRLSANPTIEIIKQFDFVFVLDSLAALGEQEYNKYKDNNKCRIETYEVSLKLMEYYQIIFQKFPNTYLIPAYYSIQERMLRVVKLTTDKAKNNI